MKLYGKAILDNLDKVRLGKDYLGTIKLYIGNTLIRNTHYRSKAHRQEIIDGWMAEDQIKRSVAINNVYISFVPFEWPQCKITNHQRFELLILGLRCKGTKEVKALAATYGVTSDVVYKVIRRAKRQLLEQDINV